MNRVLYIILFLTLPFCVFAQFDDQERIDSLVCIYNQLDDSDPNKVECCTVIAINLLEADSTLVWADKLSRLALLQGDYKALGKSLSFKAWAYYYTQEYKSALDVCYRGLRLCDSLGYDGERNHFYIYLAAVYSDLYNYELADGYYLKSIELSQRLGDTTNLTVAYVNLALNYSEQKLFSESEKMFKEAIRLDSVACNNDRIDNLREDYCALGDFYLMQYFRTFPNVDTSLVRKAKENLVTAYDIKSEYIYGIYRTIPSLVSAMCAECDLFNYNPKRKAEAVDSMRALVNEAYGYFDKLDIGSEWMRFYLAESRFNILSGNRKAAKRCVDSLAQIFDAEPDTYTSSFLDLYNVYYLYYNAVNRPDSANYYLARFFKHDIECSKVDKALNTVKNLEEVKYNEHILQMELQEQRNKRIAIYWFIGIGLILLFLAWEYLRKRKHNRVLNEKNIVLTQQREEILSQKEEILAQSDELQKQNEEISEKNKQITSSINYASLIQRAVLPTDDKMKSMFEDYFLIYRPLDIVAGDFYWASVLNKYKILVCADCTGHGVPGAFVSMLGVSLLNDVVPAVVFNGGGAADILNELRSRLMLSLGQSVPLYREGKVINQDGMDLALVMIDEDNGKLQYAGANRPLWIYRDGELIQYKPDKMPVGIYLGNVHDFTNNVIDIRKGDMLYMFSDGFADQFGYVDNAREDYKKFTTKRLAALITAVAELQHQRQKEEIEKAIDNWRNGYRQMDDNIFIGVRI